MLRHCLLLALFVPLMSLAEEPFRFSLLLEPSNLDPQTVTATSGNYLFHNIYRGLMRFDPVRGLVPEGADSCTRQKLQVTCRLKATRWSNGEAVRANDYVASFRRLIDPANRSRQSDVLFSVRNAREIWAGKLAPEKLAVIAPDERTLVIELSEEDPEFEYKLLHPALTPLPPGGFASPSKPTSAVVNGPYKIVKWESGNAVRLERNDFYQGGHPARPPLEALFVDDDSTALRLYETGKLSFLRRLAASEIPRFRNTPGFHQVAMGRFDYVGFGPRLQKDAALRKVLVEGVQYSEFLKVFDTISPAGCPSLPRRLMSQTYCQSGNLTQAKNDLKKLKLPERLSFGFSLMGGDDIARQAEWWQGQWRKNLDLKIELNGEEQGVYLRKLRTQPPDLFRKGVSLDRPTCLAALEIFLKDNPENYISLDDAGFASRVEKLRKALSERQRKAACAEAVEYLLKLNRLIPLGEMYFTILVQPRFVGWSLNELNQLDLAQLHAQGPATLKSEPGHSEK